MATKKITDLQLRSSFDETCNVPVDDASQTWRTTGAQIKSFVLGNGSVDTAALTAAVQAALVPTGSVLPFAGSSAPTGYLVCDGTQVSRTTYAALFAAIGTAHGNGNGTTTFHLPDYRGRFLRGKDGGAARDPDRATRTAMATGGATGDNVGSIQADAFQGHWHQVYMTNGTAGSTQYPDRFASTGDANYASGTAGNLLPDSVNGAPRAATETRPLNAVVNYIIKT